MKVTMELVKKLRSATNAPIVDCRDALNKANGNVDEAIKILRKKGLSLASKRSSRSASEGKVGSYVHMDGKIGVLVEVNCETDFVAKNIDFQQFVKDLCMQVAATAPLYIRREDVPQDVIRQETTIYKEQIKDKPKNAIDKIISGKLDKYFKEICLLEQPFIKNEDITINEYLGSMVGKFGENIQIRRFTRYKVGEDSPA